MPVPASLRSVDFTQGMPLDQLPDDFELTSKEAAPYCHVLPGTLEKWRPKRRGPAWVEYGDGPKPRIRYRVADVREWLATRGRGRRVDPTAAR